MPRYQAYGLAIASDIFLAGLVPDRTSAPVDLELRRGEYRAEPTPAWIFERVWADEPEPWLSVARTPLGLLLRAHGTADFWVADDGRSIEVRYVPGAAASAVEELLLDQVLPQVLHQRGELVLHASAVRLGDVAIAFVGDSGAGKSTLAAMLGDALADDCVVVKSAGPRGLMPLYERAADTAIVMLPGYPSLRLRSDVATELLGRELDDGVARTASGKIRTPTAPAHEPLPLAGIAVLSRGDTLAIAPLGKREALGELVRHLHRLLPSERHHLVCELRALEVLVAGVPVWRLATVRGLAGAADTRRTLENALRVARLSTETGAT